MNIIRNKLWNNVLVVIKLLSIAILSLTYTNSIAASYGFSTTVLNSGNAEWEENYDGPHYNTDFKRNDFAFVMDTAAAIDKLYNYRLHIGIANVSYDGSKIQWSIHYQHLWFWCCKKQIYTNMGRSSTWYKGV